MVQREFSVIKQCLLLCCSAASMYNMYDEEDDGENGNKEKNEENARIKEKMNSLRHKMENLSIAKKVAACV